MKNGLLFSIIKSIKMHRHKPYRSKVFYTSTLTYAHSYLAKTTLRIALLIFFAFSSNKSRQISSCSQQNVVNNEETMNTALCCFLQKKQTRKQKQPSPFIYHSNMLYKRYFSWYFNPFTIYHNL